MFIAFFIAFAIECLHDSYCSRHGYWTPSSCDAEGQPKYSSYQPSAISLRERGQVENVAGTLFELIVVSHLPILDFKFLNHLIGEGSGGPLVTSRQ